METLLTVIVTWISINFGLPATSELPRVEFVPPAKMAAVRFRGLAPDRQPNAAIESGRTAPAEFGQDIYALYDTRDRTIYLHEGWSGSRLADVSVLVHEMVHHLQTAAGEKFVCAQEREKDAYRAQREWLAMFGSTLEREFGIDGMTVLVRTNCGF